ncbi:protein import receptor MAS20 [Metschnikowia bicuspidata]|uniref:Mitochondrial import receptor subunit TOM20 n=1 Tax=Metschnikowia bicuspidata TaxID=27322 RepID=A0A4P9Z760_9ASCO|nr:protein import receptor MAS20 [Metschnikowia bicuspidata]
MRIALHIASVAAAGMVAYAVYFDYNRRNSPKFRKQLRKRQHREQKQAAKAQEESKKAKMLAVKKALTEDLAQNPLPTDLSKKEEFFLENVAVGEQLANDPNTKIEAALKFYKALAVYPNPTDIMGIYHKTLPEDVYELLVMMIALQPPAAITNIIGGPGGLSGAASAAHAAAAAATEAEAQEETKPSETDLD